MKIADGNKRLAFIIGFIITGLIGFFTGTDATQWADYALSIMDWEDEALRAEAARISALAVPLILAIWAAGSALWKMYKQFKAGAKITELNKPIAVIKAAKADGTLTVIAPEPVVLRVIDVGSKIPTAIIVPIAPTVPVLPKDDSNASQ